MTVFKNFRSNLVKGWFKIQWSISDKKYKTVSFVQKENRS